MKKSQTGEKMKYILSALLCLSILSSGASAADNVRIAVGLRGNWASAAAELAQRGGFYEKQGLNVEILYTQGSGESFQAVISNSVNIGIGLGMGAVMGAFAKGAPIRVIGGVATGNADLFWYVKADSPIKSLRDAGDGSSMGFSTAGSTSQVVALNLIELYKSKARARAAGDITSNLTQVMSGQLDIGFGTPPGATQQLQEHKIRIVARGDEVTSMQDQTSRVIVANTSILDSSIPARFLKAYSDALNWMYTTDEGMAAYSEYSGIPIDLTKISVREFYPRASLDPYSVTGLAGLMNDAINLKFLSRRLTDPELEELVRVPKRSF